MQFRSTSSFIPFFFLKVDRLFFAKEEVERMHFSQTLCFFFQVKYCSPMSAKESFKCHNQIFLWSPSDYIWLDVNVGL